MKICARDEIEIHKGKLTLKMYKYRKKSTNGRERNDARCKSRNKKNVKTDESAKSSD